MRIFYFMLMLCAGASAARAEPAIWQVKSATATVYLFGTMHLLPKHVEWLSPKIAAAFDASNVLIEEADIGLVQPQAMLGIMQRAESPDGDLFTMLPAKSGAKLTVLVHSCHLPESVVAHFKPWFAAMLPTICNVMAVNKNATAAEAGPEGVFVTRAKKAGKKIDFFETAEQQIGYLDNEPQKVQIAQLKEAIDEDSLSGLEAMEASWQAGDVAAIARLVQKGRRDDEDSYQTIFVRRNERFAARIAAMLQGHDRVFVAIGSGHLAGPDSVQMLLAKQGLVATYF